MLSRPTQVCAGVPMDGDNGNRLAKSHFGLGEENIVVWKS
jgi:hypothetical protein